MKGIPRSRSHGLLVGGVGLLLGAMLAVGLAPRGGGVAAQDGGGFGELTVRFQACPAGMTVETFDANACSPVASGFEIEISGDGLAMPLVLRDGLRLSNGVFRWARIPYGSYDLTVTELPAGYTSVHVPSGASDAMATPGAMAAMAEASPAAEAEDGFAFTLDDSDGSLTVGVYFLGKESMASPVAA